MSMPIDPAHAALILAVRDAGCAHHPEWADATVAYRNAAGVIVGYCLVEPDRVAVVTSEEIQSLLCGAPTP